MPDAKELELERTTRLRGYRYGLHDFLAETDLNALREMNDKVERTYLNSKALLDGKTRELLIIATCLANRDSIPHIQVHMHAARQAGATPEEILEVIHLLTNWMGGFVLVHGLEAWRATFRPDLETLDRVVELR